MTMPTQTLPASNELAIAYLRVSTDEQEKKGLSTAVQKKAAENYVEEYNRSVDFEYSNGDYSNNKIQLDENMILKETKPASTVMNNSVEETLSDSLKNRPILQYILSMAQKKQFKHLIVFTRDRLCRDFDQYIALKYMLNKNDIKIHYSRPGENFNLEDKKISRFLDNILASVAELEANIISVRVKDGAVQCVRNGNWPGGRPPYGYLIKNIEISGRSHKIAKLKPSTYEENKVLEIFTLYGKGYGYRNIARLMNITYDTDIYTKSKIEKIIKNETYTGRITWNRRGGRRHPNRKEEPIHSNVISELQIINKKQWDSLVKLRHRKWEIKDSKYFNTPYLLKDKLVCSKCQSKLKPKNYGKNSAGKNYCVYKCPTKDGARSELVIKKDFIEKLVIDKISTSLLFGSIDQLWNTYLIKKQKEVAPRKALINELTSRIKSTTSLKDNIETMKDDLEDVDHQFDESIKKDLIDYKTDLLDKLTHQEVLLQKLIERYRCELEYTKNFIEKNFFKNKDDYEAALQNFRVNLNEFDDRSKRLLIDIIVDKIVVHKIQDTIKLDIILNPPKII